jgi:hypothetical protein
MKGITEALVKKQHTRKHGVYTALLPLQKTTVPIHTSHTHMSRECTTTSGVVVNGRIAPLATQPRTCVSQG